MLTSTHKRTIAAPALAFLLLIPGCRINPRPTTERETIAKIADRLIDAAEMRVDLRQVHACLHDIHALVPEGKVQPAEAAVTRTTLARELEQEFVLVLHSRMNLVEADLMPPPSEGEDTQVSSMAKYYGASHLLVGDYSIRDDDLLISIRLVDAESMIIVAAAGGTVPVSSLSDSVRRLVRRDSLGPGVRRIRR